MPKTRKSKRTNKRKGGEYPWVELPPEAKLLNTIGEPMDFERRGKVAKPFTSSVVVDNRVYILTMWFDSDTANNTTEPYPVYFYAGDLGDVWQKDVSPITGSPVVFYRLLNGMRLEFVYRDLDRTKGNLLGRSNTMRKAGLGLEYFFSTEGLNGVFMTRSLGDEIKRTGRSLSYGDAGQTFNSSQMLIESIVKDIEKRME